MQAINRTEVLIECHLALNREKRKPKTEKKEKKDYEDYFRKKLTNVIKQAQLEVNFFIWDEFHDRYIISNLVGIMSGNSFSIGEQETTWMRLDRTRKGQIQAEFDGNSRKHGTPFIFTIS